MIFDNIVAVATAPGEGSIGIIRVSGPEAIEIVDKYFKTKSGKKLTQCTTHTIHYGHFYNEDGKLIDECLVSIMRKPKTFTSEDIVEINCHGGYLTVDTILKIILATDDVRIAQPGEFTKRAFLNGRIDLAQAESVIDIIRAKTERGLDLAVNQLKGNLSTEIVEMRNQLLSLLAVFEANIDFPEEDVPPVEYDTVSQQLSTIINKLNSLINTWHEGKIMRDGLKTAIIGKPNVGKSSLLNILVKEERAIVTDIPGTTRDVIEEVINLNGIPLKIIDTAGIRKTSDLVEKIGVERSYKLLDEADLILLMVDATGTLTADDQLIFDKIKSKKMIVLLNKIDLTINEDILNKITGVFENQTILKISTKEKIGIEQLSDHIKKLVLKGDFKSANEVTVTNSRHYAALVRAKDYLNQINQSIDLELPVDFLTIDLINSYQALGEITGQTVGEDILDKIFAEFCIGK